MTLEQPEQPISVSVTVTTSRGRHAFPFLSIHYLPWTFTLVRDGHEYIGSCEPYPLYHNSTCNEGYIAKKFFRIYYCSTSFDGRTCSSFMRSFHSVAATMVKLVCSYIVLGSFFHFSPNQELCLLRVRP